MHNLYYVNKLELLSTKYFTIPHVFSHLLMSHTITQPTMNTTNNGLESSLWLIHLGAVKEEKLNPRYS